MYQQRDVNALGLGRPSSRLPEHVGPVYTLALIEDADSATSSKRLTVFDRFSASV